MFSQQIADNHKISLQYYCTTLNYSLIQYFQHVSRRAEINPEKFKNNISKLSTPRKALNLHLNSDTHRYSSHVIIYKTITKCNRFHVPTSFFCFLLKKMLDCQLVIKNFWVCFLLFVPERMCIRHKLTT